MIRGLLYGLKKFWSEVFSGDLLILFLSIVLAVTSISSVGFLGDRLKSSMQMQASSILGADLVLRSASKIDSKYLFLGEKDYQQLYLIKKYLQLKFNTKIIGCKTIRNRNYLPLSSRNGLLSKSSLFKAEKISKTLMNFKSKISSNFNNIKLLNLYKKKISNL